MNKSYLLVICLLAASFTGCLGSDDIVDEVPVEEEETIEPVGMGDNDGNETTYVYDNETNNYYSDNDNYYVNGTDYLELISQVENLTVAVEDLTHEVKVLTDVLEEMQSSKYDVSENSSMIIYHLVENVSGQSSGEEYHVEPLYGITKEGNTITVDYLGVSKGSVEANSPMNCTSSGLGLTFYGHDGLQFPVVWGSVRELSFGLNEDIEVFMECEYIETQNSQPYDYWSSYIITLPEEPVGVYYQYYHTFD
jgi:hypothetical protein